MKENLIELAEETKKLTVLVVEDEKEANELMVSTFENFFGKVYSATNGEEGLKLYKKYEPDVVIADIIMPKMDGLELIRRIKEIKKDQIIVVISATESIEHISETVKLGVNSYIQKPVDSKKLIDMLSSLVALIKKRKKRETKTFSITVPIEIYEHITEMARDESTSKNTIVVRALRGFVKRDVS